MSSAAAAHTVTSTPHIATESVTAMPVIICFDGSDSARWALDVVATTFGSSPAVLLNVWNPPERVVADAFGVTDDARALDPGRLEASMAQHAQDVLDDGAQRAGELGMTVTTRAQRSHGNVAETILAVADELDAPVIVAGTRGNTAVEDDLLGSVSGALVHHARRPVLVVPAQPAGVAA